MVLRHDSALARLPSRAAIRDVRGGSTLSARNASGVQRSVRRAVVSDNTTSAALLLALAGVFAFARPPVLPRVQGRLMPHHNLRAPQMGLGFV